jgi:hypothetical protein
VFVLKFVVAAAWIGLVAHLTRTSGSPVYILVSGLVLGVLGVLAGLTGRWGFLLTSQEEEDWWWQWWRPWRPFSLRPGRLSSFFGGVLMILFFGYMLHRYLSLPAGTP